MACIHSISELLNVGEQTVGSFVQFKHLAPSLAGMDVVVNGELLARDQRRLYFKLNANDGVDLIAEGEHERYIIEPKRFTEKALTKLQRTL